MATDLSQLKADIEEQITTLAATPSLDLKDQLVNTVLPMFVTLLEALDAKHAETDGAINELDEAVDALDEIVNNNQDVLSPETAEQISKVFALAIDVAAELQAALPKLDEMTRRRCKGKLRALGAAIPEAQQIITEITIPLEPEPTAAAIDQMDADADEARDEAEGDDEDAAADGAEA